MVNKVHTARKAAQLSSVTQVIADGVNIVLARPMLLLIPILVDLHYWLGWRITLAPIMNRLGADVQSGNRSGSERAGEFLIDAGKLDVTGLFAIVIPSFLSGVDREQLYVPVSHGSVTINTWALGVAVVMVVLTVTAALYALFGLWLADTGMARSRTWHERLRKVPETAVRLVVLVALILGLLLLLILPIVMAWIATAVAGAEMQGLFVPLIVFVGITLIVLFYFAPEALFVADAGPADAMRLSARVVRRHVWPTLAFALATMVITLGLSEIWERMAENPPGMLIAILSSALVGCSLALAAMLFFNERWKSLEIESGTAR